MVFDTVSSLSNSNKRIFIVFNSESTSLVWLREIKRLEVVDLIGERWALYRLTAFRDDWRSISSGLSWSLPIHERV